MALHYLQVRVSHPRRASSAVGGFTLIELMIVIAIIAIIAAIAIPNLRDARKAANEASAIAALRTIHTAQNLYRDQDVDGNGTLDYAPHPLMLRTHGLISMQDAEFGGSNDMLIAGYEISAFDYDKCTLFTWSLSAWPTDGTDTFNVNVGTRQFYINQTGVIRYTLTEYGYAENAGGKVLSWPAIGK